MATLPFSLPMNFLVIGPSQSGKTEFLKQVVINSDTIFENPPGRIIWVYGIWDQEQFEDIEDRVIFTKSVPTNQELSDWYNENKKGTLLILDDLMDCVDKGISKMFFATGHHAMLGIFLTLQSVFPNNPHLRDVSLNTHCFCLFKNSRSPRQIKTLASQMFPGKSEYFMDSYFKATSPKYGYLIVDLKGPEKYKLRTKIFPPEETVVFLSKN